MSNKNKTMKNKTIIFFIGLVIIIITSIILLSSIKTPSLLDSLIAFIPPIILLFFYEYTEKDRKKLISHLTSTPINNDCIILLIGISGTGKTSLATSWGCERELDNGRMNPITGDQSTEKLEIYHKKQGDFNCTVIDYRGQDINSLLDSRDYIKYRDDIYAVIFMADVVPRDIVTKHKDKKELKVLGDQYDWLMENPNEIYQKIEGRINSNFEYLNTGVVQILFGHINILKLRNIYFLINKLDVIEKMKSDGVLPIQLEHEPKNKIRELFSKFENTLRQFCDRQIYPITNGLIIKLISTNDKRDTDKLYNEIKEKYKEWDQGFGTLIRTRRNRR